MFEVGDRPFTHKCISILNFKLTVTNICFIPRNFIWDTEFIATNYMNTAALRQNKAIKEKKISTINVKGDNSSTTKNR